MAGNEQLDNLIGQLQDTSDPRKQKKLIKQIAALEDPRCIIALATLYNKSDVDPGVKREIASALRVFRQMEAAIKGTSRPAIVPKIEKPDPDKKADSARKLPLTNELLERLRTVLIITFVLSLAGNGVLIGVRALNGPDTPQEGQNVATARNLLTESFQSRLSQIRMDASYLRARWQEIKAAVPYKCESSPFTNVKTVQPFSVDVRIYPDYLEMNTMVNEATRKVIPLRDQWTNICKTPNDKGVYKSIDGQQKIDETDQVFRSVEQAEIRLEKWINAPIATYYPSETPSPVPPSETPIPSATPIPSNTPIPSPTPIPSNTVPPTAGPSPTPVPATDAPGTTPKAPPTNAPLVSLQFQGPASFNLSVLKTYTYKVTIRYSIPVANKPSLSGSLKIQVSRAKDALTNRSIARYDVDMSETGTTFRDIKNPLIILNSKITYYLKDGRYYADTILPPNKIGCVVTAATEKQVAALQVLDNYALTVPNYTIARQQNQGKYLNNTPAYLYLLMIDDFTNSGGKSPVIKGRVEGYIDATGLTHLFTITAPPEGSANAQGAFNYSYTYELTELGTDLDKIRIPVCK